MAAVTASRNSSGPVELVRIFLQSINKLPVRSRPGLIGVVVFMVLSIATMKLLAGSAAEIVIMILGVAAAMIVIATGGRRDAYSVVFVVVLLGFSYMLLDHIKAKPAHDGSDALVVKADSTSRDDSATVSGNVRYAGSNDPVAGAFVDVEGYGARSDTTNDNGWFEISVPRRILRQRSDTVTLAIRARHTELVVRPFQNRPFSISLAQAPPGPDPAAPAAWTAPWRAPAGAFAASMGRSAATPPAAGRQQALEARFILDSVKTLHDGTSASTWWSFDVDLNHAHAITIPQRSYDRRPQRNTLHLGGEVSVPLAPRGHLTVHIRGLRDAFIGVHQVNGDAWVFEQTLQPEQPVHYQLKVAHATDPDRGEFIFYYTVIRRGTPNLRVDAGGAAGSAVRQDGRT